MTDNPISAAELASIFGEFVPMEAVAIMIAEDGSTPDQVRAKLRDMASSIQQRDDSELIETVLNIQAKHGNLVARRSIWTNGTMLQPSVWALTYVGPAIGTK